MVSVPSATTWGSPAAMKHALLIHGLTSSSHTWHRVASTLAAQGYFVTAPNLVGHASRVSSDYHFSAIANDLRPYLEARHYSLVIGHSVGANTVLNLFSHLPPSHPTAILLVEPPMNLDVEKLELLDRTFTESRIHIKPADEYKAENPLWTREDCIYRELGTRLCSIDAIHGIFGLNRPWYFFDYLNAVQGKWKVTVLLADPAISRIAGVEDFASYPHVKTVVVPGAEHWIQYDFPEVIVEEALKRVAESDAV